MRGDSKKGLSTIVSTLLILLLVFVAIGLLWVVIRNVIEGGTEEISLGKLTLDLQIETVSVAGNNINIKVKRNPGAGTFTGLSFIISDGRNSEVIEIQNASLDEYVSRTFTIAPQEIAVANIRSIEIAPIFTLESGKEVTGDVKSSYSFSGSSVGDSQVITCGVDADCASGYICTDGQCILENCAANNSCVANTCTGQTCQDSCTNVYAGTLQPDCGTRVCGLAPNQCGSCGSCATGETCSALGQCIVQNTSSATITGLAASSYDTAGPYPPEYVLDDDLSEASRWSADGSGQSITFTLSSSATVSQVQIAFYRGDSRTYTFDVQTSTDGSTWNNVLTSQTSSGTSTSLETFTFPSTSTNYVRIVGYGNTVNTWNSYTEIKVQDFASSVDLCPIMTCADTDSCTIDSCSNSQCVFTPISGCTADPCAGVTCNDGNSCTADSCSAGSCVYTPISGCNASATTYRIPTYPSASDFANTVYIDPDAADGGDGSIGNPYNHWDDITGNVQPDTAYLFKAGTYHFDVGGISDAFTNNYIGMYGTGAKPKLDANYGSILNMLNTASTNVTFENLHFYKEGTGSYSQMVTLAGSNTDVVFANNIFEGVDNGVGYPTYNIKGSSHGAILYHNEFSYSTNDGIYGGGWENAMIVSNYFHHNNMGGLNSTTSTGDSFQMENAEASNAYFANNYMDRHDTYWKFTLIINSLLALTSNFTAEYNTFVAPRYSSAGGTAVRWLAGTDNRFNKNLLNTSTGLPGLDGYTQHVNQVYPYGVRDNHFFGSGVMWTGGDANLDSSNLKFATWAEYQNYLATNGVPQYGSDIDPNNFWG